MKLQKKLTETKHQWLFTAMVLLGALVLIQLNQVLVSARSIASLPRLKNWGLQNSTAKSHISALEAWRIEEGSKDIVVAVVDTGIDANHPDIKPNLWHDPKTGVYGWDFVQNKANPIDEHSHGTHVAGIIGANFNSKEGISGVAHHVSIMAVRYYSDQVRGSDNLKNSIKALNWAIDHGANIINYSGGGPEPSQEEHLALKRAQEKGILVVAAAGNESQDTDRVENSYYPCAYRLENIICVAAIDINNKLLPTSNWGKLRVDVAAPGEKILSTIPGGRYAYMSGTSQATAFVTGLASLILAKNRSLRPAEVKEVIRASVDKVRGLEEKVYAAGKVNAFQALSNLTKNLNRKISSRKK